MPLTRIDLSGELCIEEGCTEVLFTDSTGFKVSECADEQNDLGYGLTGGIVLNDVTEAILNIYFPALTTPFKFTFTIASAVITGCILTDLNGNDIDITADLESTVFPLVEFNCNLEAYGVTFPELTDGIVKWDYTISGTSGIEDFSYPTSGGGLSTCNTDCCIEKKYLALDTECDCLEDKLDSIIMSEIFRNGAVFAINVGQDSKADAMIAKAREICDSNCQTC